jgi:hypothetical protein
MAYPARTAPYPAITETPLTPLPPITKPSIPFYPPEPKFPAWGKDMACSENMYFMLQKAGTEDPFTDNKVPTVFMAANVYQEIQYTVKRMSKKTGECGGYFLVRQLQDAKPHFLVYDYFLVGQEASGGEADLDGPDSAKYWNYLREKHPEEFGTDLHTKVWHWHS